MSMQTSTKSRNNKTCKVCKKKGHLEEEYWKKFPNKNPNRKTINSSDTSSNTSNKNTDLEDYNLESALVSSKIVKASTKQNNVISFILDSGATIHTCYIKELFNSIQSTTTAIKWGNTNNTIKASGIGNIDVIFTSTQKKVTIKDVLYIPELGVNLLSLSLITSKNFSLSFNRQNCFIYTPSNSLLTKGSYKEGVSVFSAISSKSSNLSISNKPLAILNTINTSNLDKDTSYIEELESNSTIEEDDSDLDLIDSSAKDIVVGKNIDLENINLESNHPKPNSKKEEIVLNKNTIELAHARLGHINLKAIQELIDNSKGVTIDPKDIDTARVSLDNCIICIQSKLTKNRNIEPSTKVSS
jgi:hypothetical protein